MKIDAAAAAAAASGSPRGARPAAILIMAAAACLWQYGQSQCQNTGILLDVQPKI